MAIEAFFGLSLGYNYSLAIRKEAELKQGKNEYQASACQIQGLTSFSTLVGRILSQIPYAPLRTSAAIGNALLPFAGIILCPSSAVIKQGHYEQGVKCFDALVDPYCPKLTGRLPEKLTEGRVKLFSFLSDNISKMTKIGVLVGTLALPFFGFGYLAAGIAGPMVFEALDSANLVPSKISQVTQKYMPTVANASMLVGGGVFSQAFAIAALASSIPGASTYLQKKIENLLLKKFRFAGPSLEEIDSPWEEKNDLTFEEINYILDNDSHLEYEINSAHCSKQLSITLTHPGDRNFKNFITFFEKIKWSDRFYLLKSSFRDDDRFLDHLKQKFPNKTHEELYVDFEIYVKELASEAGTTKEEFLARRLLKQINQLVAILCKEKAPKGFQDDLEDAIESCSQILAYLLNKPQDTYEAQIEIEDILIKLAIEGGNYCARGIKRTAMEISSGILLQGFQTIDDPLKNYELKVRQHLQLMRQRILQGNYQKLIEIIVRLAKEGNGVWISKESQTTDVHAVAISQDVHTMDLYRRYLTLGFYPLTNNERSQFGLSDFTNWSIYRPIRQQMYAQYQESLDEAIKEEGEIYFCNYFRQKIFDLHLLSLEQKEELIEKLTDCSEGEKTLKSFHRLFFVMQGILKIKPLCSDWTEVSFSEEEENGLFNPELEKEISEWEVIN